MHPGRKEQVDAFVGTEKTGVCVIKIRQTSRDSMERERCGETRQ